MVKVNVVDMVKVNLVDIVKVNLVDMVNVNVVDMVKIILKLTRFYLHFTHILSPALCSVGDS